LVSLLALVQTKEIRRLFTNMMYHTPTKLIHKNKQRILVYKNRYFVNLQDYPKAPKTFGLVFLRKGFVLCGGMFIFVWELGRGKCLLLYF